jgi:hypothetical protein
VAGKARCDARQRMTGLGRGRRLDAASRAPQWEERRLGGVVRSPALHRGGAAAARPGVRGTAPRWCLPLRNFGRWRDFGWP